jgi:hypothetical protein
MISDSHAAMDNRDPTTALARFQALAWPLLLGIGLIPVWAFSHYPTVDGPAHLAVTQAWISYDDPSGGSLREFFEINDRLVPNHFIFYVLAGLMRIFEPLIAEKILVSVYLISLPLALRYAARAFGPDAGWIGIMGIPVAHNALLAFGFYNTSFAIVFVLLTFGFWLRHAEHPSVRVFFGYAGFGLLCFVCHLSAVLLSVFAIASTALTRTGLELLDRSSGFSHVEIVRRFVSRALVPALGFLPAVLLAFDYLLSGRSADTTVDHIANLVFPDLDRLLRLIAGHVLVQHDNHEILATTPFIVTLLALAYFLSSKKDSQDSKSGLFGFFLSILVFYLIVPFQFHVRWVPLRLEPYVILAFILWFASKAPFCRPPRIMRVYGLAIGVTAMVIIATTVVRFDRFAEINDYLDEVVSLAEHVEPGSTLLALPLGQRIDGRPVSDRQFVLAQSGSWIALAADSIDLKNFQAHTHVVPVTFRPAVRVWTHLAADIELLATPRSVDLAAYRRATGHPIDYVVIMLAPPDFPEQPPQHPLTRALASDYRLEVVSAPRGLAGLYRYTGP